MAEKTNKKTEVLYDQALVTKRNILNEMYCNNMSLQEIRFFTIYLSKINPRDKSSRIVRFPLSDFKAIMELGRLNIKYLQQTTDRLLSKVIKIPDHHGGYTGYTLFTRCRVSKDKYDEWFVEINANEEMMPLLFDFKKNYFSYELWNVLSLKSKNQLRMYEILKQYEKLGKREIEVNELRNMLGIEKNEYPRWDNFKAKVLDSCQKALKEKTNICFTYERGKYGRGGKWLTIIFHIQKNNDYDDQLSIDQFICMQKQEQADPNIIDEANIEDDTGMFEDNIDVVPAADKQTVESEAVTTVRANKSNKAIKSSVSGFRELSKEELTKKKTGLIDLLFRLTHEFSESQLIFIADKIKSKGMKYVNADVEVWDYLRRNLELLDRIAKTTTIGNRFEYLCDMIDNNITDPV